MNKAVRLLLLFSLALCFAAAVQSESAANQEQALSETQKYVNDLAKSDAFSGVILIAKNDQPIFQKAYGYANKNFDVPNNMQTKFNLGSINKVFTRLCIQQLIKAGKLSGDDTIGKYLPDYPNKKAAETVTIDQLLNMKSGIGDFFGPKFEATPKNQIRKIADYLPLFADQPLQFDPGTQEKYSNGGYVVLGAIIEKITGTDYYSYVKANIYTPAGMTETDWYYLDEPVPNLATGYTKEDQPNAKWRTNIYELPGRGSSAGGGYSTAGDMLKFVVALGQGKFGNKPAAAGHAPAFGFAGGTAGVNSVVEAIPNGYLLIVLSNYDPPSAEDVVEKIRGWFEKLPS
ncbi:MAG TPA: serine hydrolase domain-containing protein [Acidobacteriota bacterium]|nr:serine hydrolase domain-containing protein [Acidobacteriota bacterium]